MVLLSVCRHDGRCSLPCCCTLAALRFCSIAPSVAPSLQQTVRGMGVWPASQAVLGGCLVVLWYLKCFCYTLQRPAVCCTELLIVYRTCILLHISAWMQRCTADIKTVMQATGTAPSVAPATLRAAGGASSAGGRGEGLSALHLPAGTGGELSCRAGNGVDRLLVANLPLLRELVYSQQSAADRGWRQAGRSHAPGQWLAAGP